MCAWSPGLPGFADDPICAAIQDQDHDEMRCSTVSADDIRSTRDSSAEEPQNNEQWEYLVSVECIHVTDLGIGLSEHYKRTTLRV